MNPEDIWREDTRKLHAEINQLVNQRLLVTTIAVTVFGVLNGWVTTSEGAVNAFTFVAGIMVLAFLFALFLVAFFLRRVTRVLTSYLRVSERSQWEPDWNSYRNRFRSYWAYSKTIGVVFLFLGTIELLFPFILAIIYGFGVPTTSEGIVKITLGEGLPLQVGIGLHVIAYICYLIFIWGMTFRNWWDHENEAYNNWNTLLNPPAAPS